MSQTLEDWELLISDDGSTDGSADYLATLTDQRIKLFCQKKNLGIFGNLNFLFGEAKGEISQILCQDDRFFDIGSLKRLSRLWSEAPREIGFVRANWNTRNARSSSELYEASFLPKRIAPPDSDLVFFIFGCVVGNLSNASLRTQLVRRVGWFDQKFPYAGDFEFWSRAGREVHFMLESSDITVVRSHPGQASFHLNRHGELISQLYSVVDGLFCRLKKTSSVLLLQAHATAVYDSSHRWIALRQLLARRDARYMGQVNKQASRYAVFLPSFLRWVVFFLTGGGHFGRTLAARALLRKRRFE